MLAIRFCAPIVFVTGCGRLGFDRDAPADARAVDAATIPGLVAWYAMESDPATGTSLDSSGNGLHASCLGGTCPIRVPGHSGSAIELDGVDDRFVVADAPKLRLTTGFTVTVWLQWFGGDAAVVAKPQAVGTGASFEISVLPDDVLACTDDMLGDAGEACMRRPGAMPMRSWAAVALTWNGDLRVLYIDGTQVASSEHGAAFDASALIIGGDNHDSAPSSSFHGMIDEVRVYDRALTPGEVGALYAARL